MSTAIVMLVVLSILAIYVGHRIAKKPRPPWSGEDGGE